MKKFLSILYSTRTMSIVIVLFAVAMAVATFVENDYGIPTAQALVYKAWWFEILMLLLAVNFIGNVFKYKLYKKKKWPVFLFHIAFIITLLGSFVTRYFGYEGMMPIREGAVSNTILSEKTYIDVIVDNGKEQFQDPISKEVLFGALSNNRFKINKKFRDKEFRIQTTKFINNAMLAFKEDDTATEHLHLVISSNEGRKDLYLAKGESSMYANSVFTYNKPIEGGMNFVATDNGLNFQSAQDGTFMEMQSRKKSPVFKDSISTLKFKHLYSYQNLGFVISDAPKRGKLEYVMAPKNKINQHPYDAVFLEITSGEEKEEVVVFGRKNAISNPLITQVNGLNYRINYGSKEIKTPFSIKLRDFQLDRYPGSNSPSSYASEITVMDTDSIFDYRIFMNHVLDYKGYRFFQSSYNDRGKIEQTFLSVNHDKIGTWTTYLGYGLLFLGLILSLIVKKTRFAALRKNLEKIKKKKMKLAVLVFLVSISSFAQHTQDNNYQTIDSIVEASKVTVKHAQDFGSLVIQDAGGRMKPVNTFASELLRKVSKKDTYEDFDANQVLVSLITNPRVWYFVPFIYIKKENTKVRDLIGIPHDQKYARFSDLFTEKGEYKLTEVVAKAHKKKIKNKYEESILNIDGRANLLFGALDGGIFKFFPLANDKNHKWFSVPEISHAGFKGGDSLYVSNIIPLYAQAISQATKTNDYTKANEFLDSMHKYQRKFGATVIPSEKKIKMELFYNKYDIFKGLFWKYMLASLFMFIVVIINIFNNNKLVRTLIKISGIIIALLFVYQTVGLGIRWYISGHAPWSNGYESMIYVSWATMLFGLILGKKSALTLAATTFVTSMLLMVAHWNWMDPSIGTLVPVLDSYWLMVHVAIIVASYGPFTISMILGMVVLILYAVTTDNNKEKLKLAINELTTISEMSLTIGMVLLVIGNFLGGIWANESWGRYWGWDPKETWTLVSIMVYAFVLHMRLIPGLKSKYTFNMVTMFAFTTILMTYLGVNHLLSGLHSYAQGESASIPNQIWGWLIVSVILSILALFKFKKFYKK